MIQVLLFAALTILIVVLYLRQDTLFTKNKSLNKELNYQVGKMLDHYTKILDIVERQNKSLTLLETKHKCLCKELFGTKRQDLEENYKNNKFSDPTAQKLWNFLKDYIKDDKIPVSRLEDALYMINADRIEYTTA